MQIILWTDGYVDVLVTEKRLAGARKPRVFNQWYLCDRQRYMWGHMF
jgi:hypothetical protein